MKIISKCMQMDIKIDVAFISQLQYPKWQSSMQSWNHVAILLTAAFSSFFFKFKLLQRTNKCGDFFCVFECLPWFNSWSSISPDALRSYVLKMFSHWLTYSNILLNCWISTEPVFWASNIAEIQFFNKYYNFFDLWQIERDAKSGNRLDTYKQEVGNIGPRSFDLFRFVRLVVVLLA